MKNFIDLAAEAAEGLANEYSNEPELEFLTWLRIALQREAMVSEAYDATFIDDQLSEWSHAYAIRADVIAAIRHALMGVWAQESAHRSYFAAILREVNPPKRLVDRIKVRLDGVRGSIEGQLLGGLVSGNALHHYTAKLAIIIGTTIDAVPDYVQSLRREDFSKFCNINGDLEHTAVLGYQRMITLGRKIPASGIIQETAVLVDLKRTEKDERYHEALFRALANWPPPLGGRQPQWSVLGTAQLGLSTVSIGDARQLIGSARELAYGADAEILGASTVEVNIDKISRDPFVSYMRQFAAMAAGEEASGQATMMA